jgi:enhancing lycopene biosynthesis protein 2
MAKVAVILCGSGRYDGSEIHESVLTLLHLANAGVEWMAFAPDQPQWAVCEHFEGEAVAGESRNQLQESARIARGQVQPLAEARADDFEALILPGGNGAAFNLCDFATKGAAASVNPDLARLIRDFHGAGKVIGAICIAPAIVALALGDYGPELTLGSSDDGAAQEACKAGAKMIECGVEDIHIDEKNNLVTTPAYMLGPDIAAVNKGIGKLVNEVLHRVA